MYESMVHKNKAISTERKFFILRLYTKGSAQEVIQNLPKEDRYYDVAVGILQQKFNRPHLRRRQMMLGMQRLPAVHRPDNYEGLKKLHQTAISLVYGLTDPEDYESPYNEALATQILEKLPIEMQAKWQRRLKKRVLSLRELFDFIDETAEVYETATAFSNKSMMSDQKPAKATGGRGLLSSKQAEGGR